MDFSLEERPLEEYYSRDILCRGTKGGSAGGKNAFATCLEDMPTFLEDMHVDASGSTASLPGSYNGMDMQDDSSINYDDDDNSSIGLSSNNTSSSMGTSSRRATLEFMLSTGSLRCDNVMDLYNASSEFRFNLEEFDPISEEEQHYYYQVQQQQQSQPDDDANNKNNNSFQSFWETRLSTFTNNMSVIQANWNDWYAEMSSSMNNKRTSDSSSTISSLSTSGTQDQQEELDELPDLHPMTKDNNNE